MEISTMEITRKVRDMGMEFSHGQMDLGIWECMKKMKNMEKEYCLIALAMSFKKEFGLEDNIKNNDFHIFINFKKLK